MPRISSIFVLALAALAGEASTAVLTAGVSRRPEGAQHAAPLPTPVRDQIRISSVGAALGRQVPAVRENGAINPPLQGQRQVVDRIVARVEDDILTLSEMRELGRFQELLEGRAAGDPELLHQLIEQWIVATEAEAARFPHPAAADVDRERERLEKQFDSGEACQGRLRELGLTPGAVRRLLERRLWLARYLDYKFRPAAQVENEQVEQYYREEMAPRLAALGQTVPALEKVQEQIREVLTQREISRRAERWLEETRGRLRIETEPGGGTR